MIETADLTEKGTQGRWKTIALCVPFSLVLFSPLVYLDIANGILAGKYFYIQLTTLLLIPVVLFGSFTGKVSPTIADLFVLAFLGYIVVLSLITERSLTDNTKLMYFLASGVTYFGIKQSLNLGDARAKKAFFTFVSMIIYLVVIAISLVAMFQKVGLSRSFNADFPVTGTFFHPAPLAGFLAAVLPFAVYNAVKGDFGKDPGGDGARYLRTIAIIATCCIVFILPITNSRAAFGAGVAGCLFVLKDKIKVSDFWPKRNPKSTRAAEIAIVFAILFGLLFAGYKMRETSVRGRLFAWEITMHMIADRPAVGFGVDAFRYRYPFYQLNYFKQGLGSRQQEALSSELSAGFNEVLENLAETGVIGFSLLSLAVFFCCKNRNDLTELGARGSVVSWVVFALFSYPFSMADLTLYLFVFMALADASSTINAVTGRYIVRFGLGALSLGTLVLAPHVGKQLSAYRKWQLAMAMSEDEQTAAYRELYPRLRWNDVFLSDFAHKLQLVGESERSLALLHEQRGVNYNDLLFEGLLYTQLNMSVKAEKTYWNAHYLLPSRFLPLYYLMKGYQSTDSVRALDMARRILSLEVRVPSDEANRIRLEAAKALDQHNPTLSERRPVN